MIAYRVFFPDDDRLLTTQLPPSKMTKVNVRFRDIADISLVSVMGAKAEIRLVLAVGWLAT